MQPGRNREARLKRQQAGDHLVRRSDQGCQPRGDGGKRLAMVDRRAQPRERREMLRDAIPHVALKSVSRMSQSKPCHQPIARHLGYYRRGRNREHQRIARDDSQTVATTINLPVSVDEYQFWPNRKRFDCTRQRPKRGAQDIVAINALNRSESDCHLRGRADFFVESPTRGSIEFLRIVEPARDFLRIKHNRRRHDRPGQGPPTCLVATGDRENALVERASFAPKSRAQYRFVERQTLSWLELWGHCREECAACRSSQPRSIGACGMSRNGFASRAVEA